MIRRYVKNKKHLPFNGCNVYDFASSERVISTNDLGGDRLELEAYV